MKRYIGIIAVMLALLSSCAKEKRETHAITADRIAITGVACKTPAPEPIVITTQAPYWIVITPSWITADPVTAPGGGSSICTLTIANNYKDENTDVAARSGEVVFSGGNSKLVITVSQEGYTAPVDPEASIGGIPSVVELKKFISAVNNGGKITRWLNTSGEVELLDNLDLSDFGDWTPIGQPTTLANGNNSCTYEGAAFTGKFNGAGHTISNFDLTVNAVDASTHGFFGLVKGAEIKNLTIKGNMSLSSAGTSDIGFLVGTAFCSTISGINVDVTVNCTGSSANKRFSIGGVVGFLYSEGTTNCNVSNCTVKSTLNADCGTNTGNGATGVMYGGIAGFSTAPKTDASQNIIENCTSSGEYTVKLARVSGICSTANCGTIMRSCTNNANQTNTFTNGRLGNIVCNLSTRSGLENCVNNGNIISSDSQTTTGALAALLGDDACYITGGKNTGTVIGGNRSYIGLIGANLSKFSSISDVTVGGKLGYYSADGKHEMVSITADNFQNYIGSVSDANRTKISGLKFDGSGPTAKGVASAADLTEFASLVASGGDYSKFVDDGAVVLLDNIDLKGAEWTPIGSASASNAGVVTGNPFTGVFNGKGFTVDNFKVTVGADADDNIAAGLFGVLSGATVKNVTIGSKAVISGESKKASYLGGVAGFALNSTVDNCTNNASLSVKAATNSIRECVGGIVGELYTLAESSSYVKNCENNGAITSTNTVNTNNGGSGLSVAGICGFTDGAAMGYVQNCNNKVNITAQATRLAGIVASANKNTKIESCTNEGAIKGTDVTATNSRIGGIVSGGSTGVVITGCVNRGTVSFLEGNTTQGYAAGILGQSNGDLEISSCENYGSILTDMFKNSGDKYVGAIIGNPNSKVATIKFCKVGGKVGPAVEDDSYKVVTLTSENFATYISIAPDGKKGKWVLEGNTFPE